MRDFRGLLKIAGIEKTAARDWEGMPGKPDGSVVPTGGKSDKLLLPAAGAYATYALKDHILSALTGMEHLYHATLEENVQSILENGLLTSKSLDPDTYTSRVLGSNDAAKNRVFTARWEGPVRGLAQKQKKLYGKPSKVLKVHIPYDELKDLGYTKYNPEYLAVLRRMADLRGARKPGLDKTILGAVAGPGIGSFGTRVFKHDIPPEYIVGSSKFRNGALQTLKNFPKYVAKHPARFAGGAAGTALGIASLYTLGRNTVRKASRLHGSNNYVTAAPASASQPVASTTPKLSVPKPNKGTAIPVALGSTAVATALLLALRNRRKRREKEKAS